MATTETAYSVLSIPEAARAEEGDRTHVRLRRLLEIGAFGATAVRQAKAGEPVVAEHDEVGPGSAEHEELYVVLQGACTFTVGGEEVAAPAGTAVFVRDPAARRGAVATEDDTIVLAIGGPRGEAYRITVGEAVGLRFFPLYNEKDYDGALAAGHELLEEYPGNALVLYNIACMESLLGRREDALAHLETAVAGWERLKENARGDDDFASLRGDARFEALIA